MVIRSDSIYETISLALLKVEHVTPQLGLNYEKVTLKSSADKVEENYKFLLYSNLITKDLPELALKS